MTILLPIHNSKTLVAKGTGKLFKVSHTAVGIGIDYLIVNVNNRRWWNDSNHSASWRGYYQNII